MSTNDLDEAATFLMIHIRHVADQWAYENEQAVREADGRTATVRLLEIGTNTRDELVDELKRLLQLVERKDRLVDELDCHLYNLPDTALAEMIDAFGLSEEDQLPFRTAKNHRARIHLVRHWIEEDRETRERIAWESILASRTSMSEYTLNADVTTAEVRAALERPRKPEDPPRILDGTAAIVVGEDPTPTELRDLPDGRIAITFAWERRQRQKLAADRTLFEPKERRTGMVVIDPKTRAATSLGAGGDLDDVIDQLQRELAAGGLDVKATNYKISGQAEVLRLKDMLEARVISELSYPPDGAQSGMGRRNQSVSVDFVGPKDLIKTPGYQNEDPNRRIDGWRMACTIGDETYPFQYNFEEGRVYFPVGKTPRWFTDIVRKAIREIVRSRSGRGAGG